jgi:hypothetical protein
VSAAYRIAQVTLAPRDRAQLALDASAAAARIQSAFGACCVSVASVATGADDVTWRASVVIDARNAKDAKLLYDHASDERLWKSFIEALYSEGACDVVAIEAVAAPPTVAQPKPR